jgi:hypothetical protein
VRLTTAGQRCTVQVMCSRGGWPGLEAPTTHGTGMHPSHIRFVSLPTCCLYTFPYC